MPFAQASALSLKNAPVPLFSKVMCLSHDLLTKFSVLPLLPYECSVSVIHVIAYVTFCLHMKVILLSEEGNLPHQLR